MMFDTLLPIIVPRSYFQYGNWPGYYLLLRHPDLAVTWVELSEPMGMDYVNVTRHAEIEKNGHDVHTLAMSNLRRVSSQLGTHSKTEGSRNLFHAMMHEDGLGTSRLLLLSELDACLPQGYWIGIPERSCGIVVPKDISTQEHKNALEIVQRCYEEGTTPMLPGLFEREMFEVQNA